MFRIFLQEIIIALNLLANKVKVLVKSLRFNEMASL